MHRNTEQTGRTPLHHATYDGHCSVVECLITSGADVNAIDIVSLILCIYYTESLHHQIRKTSLHIAADEGHDSVVQCLITSGADVNAIDIVSLILCTYLLH